MPVCKGRSHSIASLERVRDGLLSDLLLLMAITKNLLVAIPERT